VLSTSFGTPASVQAGLRPHQSTTLAAAFQPLVNVP
jgi:hypothetical protein